MKKEFLGKDLFLENNTAKGLYFDYAKDMPIIDFHCHLNPKEIYENRPFENLFELWLQYDHYKWRLMRNAGIEEKYITGDSLPYEKYLQYVKAIECAFNNPLYIWSHLELQKYFGINEPINQKNAKAIWEKTLKILQKGELTPKKCIKMSNVKTICTTDDILSNLEYHKLLKGDRSFETEVLPTFRGDRAITINHEFLPFIKELEKLCKRKISSINDFIIALQDRIDYFCFQGCKISDFSFSTLPKDLITEEISNEIFLNIIKGKDVLEKDRELMKGYILFRLCKYLAEKNIAVQFHIGATRNNSTRMLEKLGKDCGCDSISDENFIEGLKVLLNNLDKENLLPRIIVYNLNSTFNNAIMALIGSYNGGGGLAKLQYGPAWWFLDHKNGIKNHFESLTATGHLGSFVGMLTDSRSFLSYTRHDYFRRLLCEFLGNLIEKGELFGDIDFVGSKIKDICFYNAKNFFLL